MVKPKLLFPIIIIMLFLLGGCSSQPTEIEKKAEHGLLDLTQFNLKNEIIPLDGEWAFYWNQLLEPDSLDQGSLSGYVPFPSSWNKYEIDDQKIPGSGYATYQLTFVASDNEILALKLPKVRTAYKLWVNGELIATAGTLGTTREAMVPQYLPQIISFEALQGENTVVLQASNFYMSSGGLLTSIFLGGETGLLTMRYNGLAYELFLFGALMMMGVYHLALFFFRKKDRAPLYFGLFCILVAIRTLLIGESFLYFALPDLDFTLARKIQTLTYYLGVPLILMFFRAILPDYFHLFLTKIVLVMGIAYTAVVIFAPTNIYSTINPIYQIWTIFLIIYLFTRLLKIAFHKEKSSGLIILGGLALIATSLIDIITLSPWINDSWPPLIRMIFQGDANSSTGQLIFACLYSLLLAKNFSESLEYRTVMGEKLIEMNTHLDELVLTRTKDLTESNKKVAQQNLELEQINQELQLLSLNDPLTGLWNRRKYKETVGLEWQRCLNHQKPISLLFIDVDYFKNYNDLYGHAAGDECLVQIGAILKATLARPSDMAVRYGGEEFVVLLSETGKEDALKIARLLLKRIDQLGILHQGSAVKNCITVSIGVASLLPGHHSRHEDLIEIADKALYHAKAKGRNQVVYLDAASHDTPV